MVSINSEKLMDIIGGSNVVLNKAIGFLEIITKRLTFHTFLFLGLLFLTFYFWMKANKELQKRRQLFGYK